MPLVNKLTNTIVSRTKSANWNPTTGVWAVDDNGEVVDTVPATLVFEPAAPTVSAIAYKMLFTSAERIAAKASIDPVIVDLQELLNDPRTTNIDLSLQSISDALDYMTVIGLIAAGRKAEILTGVVR